MIKVLQSAKPFAHSSDKSSSQVCVNLLVASYHFPTDFHEKGSEPHPQLVSQVLFHLSSYISEFQGETWVDSLIPRKKEGKMNLVIFFSFMLHLHSKRKHLLTTKQ